MFAIVSTPDASAPTRDDVPDPTPGAREVLVRLAASAINPADVLTAAGPMRAGFGLEGTVGLGWDVAGTVEAVGGDVSRFAVGDLVAAVHDDASAPSRAHAALVALPEDAVAPIPHGLDLVAAGSIPMNALTAHQALDALEGTTGAAAGRRLLVTGAAGAVGGYALDLARERGWEVHGLARESDADFVSSVGAHLVREIHPGAYDAVLDAASLRDDALSALRTPGTYAGLTGPWREDMPADVAAIFVFVHADGRTLESLLERSLQPSFAPRIAHTFPLSAYAQAYGTAAERGLRGRVVLLGE